MKEEMEERTLNLDQASCRGDAGDEATDDDGRRGGGGWLREGSGAGGTGGRRGRGGQLGEGGGVGGAVGRRGGGGRLGKNGDGAGGVASCGVHAREFQASGEDYSLTRGSACVGCIPRKGGFGACSTSKHKQPNEA
uniref:Uncharacterized protein n=1 Tax=Oryza nivara TaxID=4536 RepID=A0A0E0HCX0_ORYNI